MSDRPGAGVLAARLAAAGFVAAADEADQLLGAAAADPAVLDGLVERRLRGEPLAWVTGRTSFCGVEVVIDPGVYVPRPQSEALARRAAARLSEGGAAADLCTGSGAIARVLGLAQPNARVLAGDVDERAVACARRNGVDARVGDLFDVVPRDLVGALDVVVAVVPYVPTAALALLPSDTFRFEAGRAYDGGADGTDVLRRLLAGAPRFLRPGGALLVELGGEQARQLSGDLQVTGFSDVTVLTDEDGDVRGVEATWRPAATSWAAGS